MRRFDKHIPILSGLGDWARLRLILGGSNECPPATVSSYTVVVSHLAFGTLSLWSINAPRWRRSWNVWISCSQDGRQGSQHLIRFSVGHFALAQGNPGEYRTASRRTKKFCAPDHSKHSSTS